MSSKTNLKALVIIFAALTGTAKAEPFATKGQSARPAYKAGEIIVKFKSQTADMLAEQLTEGRSSRKVKLSNSLDKLNYKYKVKKIEPIIKGFKAKRKHINALLIKDTAILNKREKHLLRRLKRRPRGVEVPDLGSIYTIELEDGQSAVEAAAEYNKDPDVEYAELNGIFSLHVTPNDPNYAEQWALNNIGQPYPIPGGQTATGTAEKDINAPEGWDINTGSSDVVVAVADTGVDYRHLELRENMWTDANGSYGYDFVGDDNNPADNHGHGTHCAGIIAADSNNGIDIAGVCWRAKIMAVKIFGSQGNADLRGIVEGIYYATDNGADIISNSWGGSFNYSAIEDAFKYAYSEGVCLIASAGNTGGTDPGYPAYYDEVIAVSATDANDEKYILSTYGDWIDVAAPGVDVLSLRASNTDMYGDGKHFYPYGGHNPTMYIASGTSMACPHVAGLAALCLAEEPNLNCEDVRILIKYYADDIYGMYLYSNYSYLGAGRINVYETLNNISNFPEPNKATAPYPDDTATLQSVNLHLSWTRDELASSHDVYIGTNFDDVNDANRFYPEFMGNVFLAQFDPNTLETNTTYYWRIDERNYSNVTKGDVWSFTTRGGDIIYVDVNAAGNNDGSCWEDAYSSLTEALSIAWDDQIWVAKGIYTPEPNERTVSFAPREHTKLYGGFAGMENSLDERDWGNNATILSGNINEPNDPNDNCYHVLIGSDGAVIDGFTITEGFANYEYPYADSWGGGMYNNNSSPIVSNCIFIDNFSRSGGGAMYNQWGSNPVVSNCIFRENSTYNKGGAIHNNGFIVDSSAIFSNCSFIKNSAINEGGAIKNFHGSPTVVNCIFRENNASSGGGISDVNSSATVINCVFAGNITEANGGGSYSNNCSSKFINCTFSNNSAGDGGGIYNCGGSSVNLMNCILRGSEPNQIVDIGCTTRCTYSNVQGGWPGEGNIDTEAYFVKEGYWDTNGTEEDANDDFWVEGDYHLKSEGWRWDATRQRWDYDDVTSRCIDAGNPGCSLGDELLSVPKDPNNIWGENLRINMGAYGGTAEASMPPYGWALLGDLTNDGTGNFRDYALQAVNWLKNDECQSGDLNRDELIDIADTALLADDWLKEISWRGL